MLPRARDEPGLQAFDAPGEPGGPEGAPPVSGTRPITVAPSRSAIRSMSSAIFVIASSWASAVAARGVFQCEAESPR